MFATLKKSNFAILVSRQTALYSLVQTMGKSLILFTTIIKWNKDMDTGYLLNRRCNKRNYISRVS
jgi:hypothetical protein